MTPFETALMSAVAALAAAIVALFYIYVRHRDSADGRYERFTNTMLPLLTQLKGVADEMNGLVRELMVRGGGRRE